MEKLRHHRLFYFFSLLGMLYFFTEAYRLAWICDDAFISFSYARNLAEGNGLVFTPGEYVEGISNILWTIFLSIGIFLHISPVLFSIGLGYLFTFFFFLLVYRMDENLGYGRKLPFFLLQLSFFPHLHIFATSGLETSLYIFLITAGLWNWWHKNTRAVIYFFFAALTRPDGNLFFSSYVFFVIWEELSQNFSKVNASLPKVLFDSLRNLFRSSIVVWTLFFCLSFLIRYLYYGDILPNTFYAKVGLSNYTMQGLRYFFYLIWSYPLILVLVFAYFLFFLKERNKHRVATLIVLLFYFCYVIWVGGDFMALRFWMPILPFLSYIFYERLVGWEMDSVFESFKKKKWGSMISKNLLLVQLCFLLIFILRIDPLLSSGKRESNWYGIGEERKFYGKELLEDNGYDKNSLTDFRVSFMGAQAHFIYYFRPAFAFEAEAGLTDREYARKPLLSESRGRVGHERKLEIEDWKTRNIEITLKNPFPHLNLPKVFYEFRGSNIPFYVLHFDERKFAPLCQRPQWTCTELYERVKMIQGKQAVKSFL